MDISSSLSIPDKELLFTYINASGPGGQNVNKVATAVQLRFDVRNTRSLEEELKARLVKLAGNRMTKDGILIIEAKRYRTQEQNRLDAMRRFISLIQQAQAKPKKRRPTHPTILSQDQRLEAKKNRGKIKRLRHTTEE